MYLLKTYSEAEHVNVGTGKDLEISELAQLVCDVVGFTGSIEHDLSKPDGTPRKLMSADKIRGLGWSPKISLKDGLERTYQWYLASNPKAGAKPLCAATPRLSGAWRFRN